MADGHASEPWRGCGQRFLPCTDVGWLERPERFERAVDRVVQVDVAADAGGERIPVVKPAWWCSLIASAVRRDGLGERSRLRALDGRCGQTSAP